MDGNRSIIKITKTGNESICFDGHVSKYEYADAEHCVIKGPYGEIDIFIKIADGYLYFASQLPNPNYVSGHDIVIMLEPENVYGKEPSSNAIRAYIRRKSEHSRTHKGPGWPDYWGPWEFKCVSYKTGWEAECRISLDELGIDLSKKTEMGLAFRSWDKIPKGKWNWPEGSDEDVPETWGTLLVEVNND